jgi:polyisoprenoid-binding protein YceI
LFCLSDLRNLSDMKRIIVLALFLYTGHWAFAQYDPVSEGTSLTFKVKNFGFNTDGFFSGIKGTIQFDPANAGTAIFDVTVDANSVNTDNESRDSHLREESYFDVKNHPVIHFISTKVVKSNKDGAYTITGNLTIKATTKSISFPFLASPSGDGYIFKGDFKINRRDFDVGGSSTIADNVQVSLIVTTKKNKG